MSDASRVFIYTPIGINTGGPEALYQLADGLKNLGIQTFLVPTMETVHNSTCEVFSQYEAHIYTGNTFKPNDILIVPESVERLPNRLVNSFRNNLVIYWLSVDYAVYKGYGTLKPTTTVIILAGVLHVLLQISYVPFKVA